MPDFWVKRTESGYRWNVELTTFGVHVTLLDRVFELAKNVDRLKEKNLRFYRTYVLKKRFQFVHSICFRIRIPRKEDSGSFVS